MCPPPRPARGPLCPHCRVSLKGLSPDDIDSSMEQLDGLGRHQRDPRRNPLIHSNDDLESLLSQAEADERWAQVGAPFLSSSCHPRVSHHPPAAGEMDAWMSLGKSRASSLVALSSSQEQHAPAQALFRGSGRVSLVPTISPWMLAGGCAGVANIPDPTELPQLRPLQIRISRHHQQIPRCRR